MSDTDRYLPCLRCSAPASLGPIGRGEDHVPPDRSTKGMGGTSDPEADDWTLAFCRKCHKDRHLKVFTVTHLEDGKLELRERNGKKSVVALPDPLTEEQVGEFALAYPFTPAMTLRTMAVRLPYCEDNVLADLWARGTERAYEGQALEALVALAFRMRYGGYGQEWYGRAARRIAEQTNSRVSAATVYDRYALAVALEACDWDLEALRAVGTAALAAAGKVCDVPAAVGRVRVLREDDHETAAATIRLVRSEFSDDVKNREPLPEPVMCTCPECGNWHRRAT